MRAFKWLLQRFADGSDGGTSAGDGAVNTGVTPADAGQGQQQEETLADRLRQMGVPEEKLQRRAYQRKVGKKETSTNDTSAQAADAAQAAQNPQTQGQENAKTYSEDDVQRMIQRRVANLKPQSDAMKTLGPALEMLIGHYGLDSDAPDYEALAQAILDDNSYYEQRAIDMGVPVDVAKKLEAAERLEAARQHDAEMNERDRQYRAFRIRLEQQADAMKAQYPDFDLQREMENDTFMRMVSPGIGMTVEQAFNAVHHNELMEAAKRAAQQNLSSSIQANRQRPNESGSRRSGTAPAHDLESIRRMPRERRQELIERMRRGEKITPDMMY